MTISSKRADSEISLMHERIRMLRLVLDEWDEHPEEAKELLYKFLVSEAWYAEELEAKAESHEGR